MRKNLLRYIFFSLFSIVFIFGYISVGKQVLAAEAIHEIDSEDATEDDSEEAPYPDIEFIESPVVNTPVNTATGVSVSWNPSEDADGYYVYRRIKGGSWEKIAEIEGGDVLSYMDEMVSSGITYEYTICAYCQLESDIILSDFDEQGKEIRYVAAPKITMLETVNGGVKISWEKVMGAEKYRVYYKTDSKAWERIAETKDTSFTWTGAKSGTTYTYTIRCVNNEGNSFTSWYDETGTTLNYVATPQISSVENVNGGIRISWGKVTGAEKYRVYYKTGSSSWTNIGETTATSYTWTGAKSGTTYAFTVRCLDSESKYFTSWVDGKGKSLKYIVAPQITSLENVNGGVKISWGKVAGAEKYRVYYKTSSSSWIRIAETTATSYTWTGAKSGTTYTYTVRCLNSAGNSFTSGFDGVGKSLKYVAVPQITSLECVNGGVKISWGKVAGAEKYRVYYKTGSGSWTRIDDTTSTSYTWTGAKNGTTYAYTVRCLNSAGNTFTSWYDAKGKSLKSVATPQVTGVENVYGGIKISWGKVTGADKYRVYYKLGSGVWTRLAETTSTNYTWTGAKSGTTYTFTVRCISSDGQSFTSSVDSKGRTMKYIAAPKLSSVANVSGGIKITWEQSIGAAKYRVYYKTTSGIWTRIADTTSTSYIWTGAKQGVSYRFTVRCISSDGKQFTSWFDETGIQINDLLVLVNPTHKIPDGWTVDLVSLGGGNSVDRRAYNDLQAMLNDCRAAGGRPLICSSYRTHNRQIELYNNKVSRLMNQGYSKESAKVEAARWVALPGTSEHELGLALDIVDLYYQGLDSKQANTATQKWLMSNSYKYGFILRYQSNKVNITGIGNEPWHYRYVGKEPATYMYQNGLCLEEYLELR